jgi:hypothetical protein
LCTCNLILLYYKYLSKILGRVFRNSSSLFYCFCNRKLFSNRGGFSYCIAIGRGLSGGAYNPANAITLLASGKLNNSEIVPYIIAEILGALVGLKLVKAIME